MPMLPLPKKAKGPMTMWRICLVMSMVIPDVSLTLAKSDSILQPQTAYLPKQHNASAASSTSVSPHGSRRSRIVSKAKGVHHTGIPFRQGVIPDGSIRKSASSILRFQREKEARRNNSLPQDKKNENKSVLSLPMRYQKNKESMAVNVRRKTQRGESAFQLPRSIQKNKYSAFNRHEDFQKSGELVLDNGDSIENNKSYLLGNSVPIVHSNQSESVLVQPKNKEKRRHSILQRREHAINRGRALLDNPERKGYQSLLGRYQQIGENPEPVLRHQRPSGLPVLGSGTPSSLIHQLCNVKSSKRVCYQHGASTCYCYGGLARCSGRPYRPNIPYAPKFPKGVKCLISYYNGVVSLFESFFHNVTDFQVIDFSYNQIKHISERTFSLFQNNLKYLILSYNQNLKPKYIDYILQFPPSIRLDLNNIRLEGPNLPSGFFEPYANIPTQEFHFDSNFFPHLDLRKFAVLKNLRFLSFIGCNVQNVTSASMKALTGLDLGDNFIKRFPTTCQTGSNMTSFYPKLKMLYLNSNNISELPNPTETCAPSVVLLGLARNNISSFESRSLANFSSLKVLYLDEMRGGVKGVAPHAFSSKSLISLHMSKNNIDFSSPKVSLRLLQDCPRLDVLYLSHNNMSGVSPAGFESLLVLPRLQHLYLGSCHLKYVPTEGLSQLKKLNSLFLYVNEIKTLPAAAFDVLTSLQLLHLDQNLIHVVDENVFSADTVARLVKIDLSANDFQCNCDLIWFKQWLVEDGSKKFVQYPDHYTCANIPAQLVIDFAISRQACYFSRNTYVVFVVCLSILLSGFLIFVVLFKYRWHLRLAIYEWRSRAAYARHEEEEDYVYDVFIIYCNDDSDWVLDQLLGKVETRWGYRAFIHERDFQAGQHIIDNMVRAMNLSRRIMVVLSPNFALSKWCNFELLLSQSHIIEHDLPSILVLQMAPIPERDMTAMMVAMRNTTTFLEWPEVPEEEPLFWRRLKRCMEAMQNRHRLQPGERGGGGRELVHA